MKQKSKRNLKEQLLFCYTEFMKEKRFIVFLEKFFPAIMRIFLAVTLLIFLSWVCFSFWEKKSPISVEESQSLPEIKISFLTDLHIKSNKIGGNRANRQIKKEFLDTIKHFKEKSLDYFNPDAIVINGDVIEGTNRDAVVGRGELEQAKKFLADFSTSEYWVVGNHDLRAVTKKDWKESLGINYLFRAFDLKGYRLIVLDSNFDNPEEGEKDIEPGKYFTRGRLSQLELKWLKVELAKNNKPTLIFIHHPPLVSSDIKTSSQLLYNGREFQNIVSKNGNVLAVFSGHIEELHHKIKDGIHYFIIPGTTKDQNFQKTFSEITVNNTDVQVKIEYTDEKGNLVSRNIENID